MTTPQGAFDAFFQKCLDIIKDEIFNVLAKLGEESVRKIRDRSFDESWIDHTANLRSSIGYSIYDYGVQQIQSAFETVKSGTLGSAKGKKMVADLAKEYSNVFALVVVAAMEYADKVEAIWAQDVVNERLEKAKEVAINKINALTL